MGKFIIVFSIIFIVSFSGAQTIMNIHTNAGKDVYNVVMIDSITFTIISDTSIVTDIDGNIYHKVGIGSQVWLKENLKVTRYRNGDPIPHVLDDSTWITTTGGAYCNYYNSPSNGYIYGRLYNWWAINDSRGLAPEGWHVASETDWLLLVNFLGGNMVAGGALRDSILWEPPNTGANNSSGFSALPGGQRNIDAFFNGLGIYAYFWSSTAYAPGMATVFLLNNVSTMVMQSATVNQAGCSIRLIKD